MIDKDRIPEHIAIIMDGNGRWAKSRGKVRSYGHQAGVDVAIQTTENCVNLGVKYLTLYTFSTENWNRPSPEVATLMKLMFDNLDEAIFNRNNVRMRIIGDVSRVPEYVRESILRCERNTAKNDGMTLVIALSYSSRWELTEAMRAIANEVAVGRLRPEDITEETISQHLCTNFMPDPDLLIRTGGELRISNYLLWQAAYSELYFTDTFWPDFDMKALETAIEDYQSRERRYGKTSEQVTDSMQNAQK